MKKKDKFFLKMFLLITVLVITVITVFACSIYSYSSKKTKESIANVSIKLVSQIESFVDSYVFQSAEVFASKHFITISDDMNISRIYGKGRLEQGFIYQYFKELEKTVSSENFIRGVHLYIPHRNMIISSDGICYLDDDDKPTLFETEKKHVFEQVLKYNKKWIPTYKNSNSENVITMIIRYSPHNESIPTAVIAVDILEENVQMIFSKFSKNDFSSFAILDENGKMISNSDKTLLFDNALNESYIQKILEINSLSGYFVANINGSDSLVSYVKSDYNSWMYLSIQDIGVISESNRLLLVFTLFVSFLTVLIGFIGAYFVSNNYYFSLRNIVALVSNGHNDFEQSDVYTFLKNSIYGMSDDLKKYHKLKTDVIPIAKNNLAYSFTHDANLDFENICRQYEIIGIDKDSFNVFAVCKCQFNNTGNDDNAYFEYGFIEYMYSLNSENRSFLCFGGGIQPVTVVICAKSHEDLNLPEFTEKLKQTFYELKINDYVIFISEAVSSIYDISELYSKLTLMEKYSFILSGRQVFGYNDYISREHSNKRLEHEKLFKNLSENLDAKNIDNTVMCVSDMITTLKRESFSYDYVQDFLLQLIGYIFEYMKRKEMDLSKTGIDSEAVYQEYRTAQSIDNIMGVIQEVCVKIVCCHDENIKENEISKKVISFVKELPDTEMKNVNLMFVADKMLLSTAYISRNFKSETGKKFLDWLTDEKLERSARILKDRRIKIKDICDMMGYSNSNYFIRKFKEKYGITPKQYQAKDCEGM